MLPATLSQLHCQERSTDGEAGQNHVCQQQHAEQMLTTKEAADSRTSRQKPRDTFQEEQSTTCRNQPLSCIEWDKTRSSEHRDNPARLSPYKQYRLYFSIVSVCRAVADKLASKINYFTVSAAATSCLVLWAARGRLGNAFCRALAWGLRESLSSSLPFQRVIRVKAHTNRNQNT